MKELEVVYVEDFEIGGFTAFAPKINWAVAEGDSREEAKANLFRIIEDKFNDDFKNIVGDIIDELDGTGLFI